MLESLHEVSEDDPEPRKAVERPKLECLVQQERRRLAARGPGRVKAEELLVTNDLWTAVLRRAEPEIVAVRREERSRRSASYVVLDADEVDLVAHLVSLRVLVVAPVEQLEPRASATLLRRRRDEFGLDLLLAGGTRRIVVCGRVAEVIPFLAKLRAWDEAGTIPD